MLKFLIFALFAAASASIVRDGSCPDTITPLSNFDFKAFSGEWYEYAKYPTDAERNGQCAKVNYFEKDGELIVKDAHIIDGVQWYVDGTFSFPQGRDVGELTLSFKFGETVRTNTLSIIDTDYTNYAIFYMCKTEGNKRNENLWIASRSKTLDGAPMAAVVKFLKDNQLESSKLVDTDFSEEACKFTERKLITIYPYEK